MYCNLVRLCLWIVDLDTRSGISQVVSDRRTRDGEIGRERMKSSSDEAFRVAFALSSERAVIKDLNSRR